MIGELLLYWFAAGGVVLTAWSLYIELRQAIGRWRKRRERRHG